MSEYQENMILFAILLAQDMLPAETLETSTDDTSTQEVSYWNIHAITFDADVLYFFG